MTGSFVIARSDSDEAIHTSATDRMDCLAAQQWRRKISSYCRAISAAAIPSPSSFWSGCMSTVTRSNFPVNSNGAS